MPSPDYALTAKYALRALKGDSNISDIDAGFLALAQDSENKLMGYMSGTSAGRVAQSPLDGLVWHETDTGGVYLGNGTVWQPLLIPWTDWTPTFTAATTAMSLGNSVLVARYSLSGKRCLVRLALSAGTTFNGGSGAISFSLPFTASATGEQDLSAKLFTGTSTPPAVWAGIVFVPAGSSSAAPYFPQSPTAATQGPLVNAAGGGLPQCPLLTAGFPLQSGNNLEVWGEYEVA